MSVFYCPGCGNYRDSDIDGYHYMTPANEYLCDNCECKYHEEEFKESMDQFRKMAKMGEM